MFFASYSKKTNNNNKNPLKYNIKISNHILPYTQINVFINNLQKMNRQQENKYEQNHCLGWWAKSFQSKALSLLSWLKPVCLGIGSAALVPASQPSKVLTWPWLSLCWSWIQLTKSNTCRHLFLHHPVPSRAAENQGVSYLFYFALDDFYPQSLNCPKIIRHTDTMISTKWR